MHPVHFEIWITVHKQHITKHAYIALDQSFEAATDGRKGCFCEWPLTRIQRRNIDPVEAYASRPNVLNTNDGGRIEKAAGYREISKMLQLSMLMET